MLLLYLQFYFKDTGVIWNKIVHTWLKIFHEIIVHNCRMKCFSGLFIFLNFWKRYIRKVLVKWVLRFSNCIPEVSIVLKNNFEKRTLKLIKILYDLPLSFEHFVVRQISLHHDSFLPWFEILELIDGHQSWTKMIGLIPAGGRLR